jgi:PKD repeat protein
MVRIIMAVICVIVPVLAGLAGCGQASPEAAFLSIPPNCYAPEEVQFVDLSQGNITAWQWDFDNDGVVDSDLQFPKYTYNDPGNYTISLTVIGPDGNDTEIKSDYLKFIPCPHFADFIADITEMNGRNPIQFTDLSVTDTSMGNATSWAWDFNNDGTIDSTAQNPSYVYTRNGVYSVTLTVTTPECEDTVTKQDYIMVTGCSG